MTMVTIYNTELFKELKDGAKIQQTRDIIPQTLAGQVVPVMEVNPKMLKNTKMVLNSGRTSTSGSSTLKTITKQTFLTGLIISLSKGAACDAATGRLTITVTPKESGAIILAGLPFTTLMQESTSIAVDFPPLELSIGSTIVFSAFTFAAGSCSNSCSIYGYELDNYQS